MLSLNLTVILCNSRHEILAAGLWCDAAHASPLPTLYNGPAYRHTSLPIEITPPSLIPGRYASPNFRTNCEGDATLCALARLSPVMIGLTQFHAETSHTLRLHYCHGSAASAPITGSPAGFKHAYHCRLRPYQVTISRYFIYFHYSRGTVIWQQILAPHASASVHYCRKLGSLMFHHFQVDWLLPGYSGWWQDYCLFDDIFVWCT